MEILNMRKNWWLILGMVVIAGSAQAKGRTRPSQMIDIQGQVDRFTLSSDGQVDGFLLDDGTEVHVGRYLAAQLAQAVKQGEPVRVRGVQVPGVRVVAASSVTSESTQEAISGTGEARSNFPTPAIAGTPDASGGGAVKQLLHGYRGQVDGAVLDNGLVVRLPPNAPIARADLFVVGHELAVRGEAFETASGRVIRIDSIGASDDDLSPVRQTGLEPQPPIP
jgi:hypothetical protein